MGKYFIFDIYRRESQEVLPYISTFFIYHYKGITNPKSERRGSMFTYPEEQIHRLGYNRGGIDQVGNAPQIVPQQVIIHGAAPFGNRNNRCETGIAAEKNFKELCHCFMVLSCSSEKAPVNPGLNVLYL